MNLPNILFWLFLCLGTYRIALLIAEEEGPFSIFYRIRYVLGAYDYAENGEAETIWGRGIACAACVGMYVSLVAALIAMASGYYIPTIGNVFFVWFGIAGIQLFLFRVGG